MEPSRDRSELSFTRAIQAARQRRNILAIVGCVLAGTEELSLDLVNDFNALRRELGPMENATGDPFEDALLPPAREIYRAVREKRRVSIQTVREYNNLAASYATWGRGRAR